APLSGAAGVYSLLPKRRLRPGETLGPPGQAALPHPRLLPPVGGAADHRRRGRGRRSLPHLDADDRRGGGGRAARPAGRVHVPPRPPSGWNAELLLEMHAGGASDSSGTPRTPRLARGRRMKGSIRDKVAIIGAGCSDFGERWDKAPEDLIVEATY